MGFHVVDPGFCYSKTCCSANNRCLEYAVQASDTTEAAHR